MENSVCVIGGGLAGSEAVLQLAKRGVQCTLVEARPESTSPVHSTDLFAELVCSNSLKSEKPDSAAGMLKVELGALGSSLYGMALETRVAAGGALAVDRMEFAKSVTEAIGQSPYVNVVRHAAASIEDNGCVMLETGDAIGPFDAIVVATGPLTTDAFASWLREASGSANMAFFDAAAPIVMADSLDRDIVFSQSRYEEGQGDYLNAPFSKEEYDRFIEELVNAKRAISRDFESKDLFQACQPIEEIARSGADAPRFGPLKPVGLQDPRTGKRPWAAVQLRSEDKYGQSFNLVGFQTNLTFPEQERVFRMIPGLGNAEFARYGVMHRNTFLDSPRVMDARQRLAIHAHADGTNVFLAGQISGTEGYCEAIRSGLNAAIEVHALLKGVEAPSLPRSTVYGSLLAYATDANVKDYQPMHVNFGIIEPLERSVRNKRDRYHAYAARASEALDEYVSQLVSKGLLQR